LKQVTVLFFATLRDKTGTRFLKLDIEPGTSVAQIKASVVQKFPVLSSLMEYCLVSINREYCDDETVIPFDAEIAFFPPVSGG